MAEQDPHVLGEGGAMLTPVGHKMRPTVQVGRCIKEVPPAAEGIIGKCTYYYQPLHGEYVETVEKVSVSSAWETVKAFATSWDPWKDKEVARRLLHRREQLIAPESTESDWSRHGNFMMQHIGCGHKPPSYYVSYGYYYCSHYGAELFPKLSAAGQDWLRNARWNLQKNMEDGLNQNMQGDVIRMHSRKPGNGGFSMRVARYALELNDKIFIEFAFKTHPLAYLDGGIARLPAVDLYNIMRQPNIQEWGSWGTYQQAGSTAVGAVKTWVGDASDAASEATDDLLSRALRFLMTK